MNQVMNWTKAKQMYDLLSGVVCVADLSKLPNFSVIYSLSVSVCVYRHVSSDLSRHHHLQFRGSTVELELHNLGLEGYSGHITNRDPVHRLKINLSKILSIY